MKTYINLRNTVYSQIFIYKRHNREPRTEPERGADKNAETENKKTESDFSVGITHSF